MATFKLEGEADTPEPGAPEPGSGAPQPKASPPAPTADEFSFFLQDESPAPQPGAPPVATPRPQAQAPQAQVPVQRSAAPPTGGAPRPVSQQQPAAPSVGGPPAPAGPPTRVVAPLPASPNTPRTPDNSAVLPPTATPAQPTPPAGPNLMRPAQARADKSQPPGINVPAAIADSPTLTQPDAASIAQDPTPSDDLSSGFQNFSDTFTGILDKGEDLFTWAARLALPIAGLSLAYILAAIFAGGAPGLTNQLNPTQVNLVHFMVLASKAFSYSMIGLAVALLLLSYNDNRLGAIVTGVALAMGLGVPILLRVLLGPNNIAATQMTPIFFHAGRLLLPIGLFKATIDLGVWAWNLPNKIKSRQSVAGAVGFGKTVESKQQRIARNANMFSPCWNLPFCREAIRVLCPAYLARKTCWKFGRGCYCDEEMVGRIVRNEPVEAIKAATTRQSKEAPPCARCYIFLEHQTHKFRMMSPLALPGTIALMFAGWPIYNQLFYGFTMGYTKLFSTLSFNVKGPDAIAATDASKAAANAAALSPQDIAQYSSYVMAALLGFFLLIYISKGIEWAIFKAKW